jgi:hypothetical protein
MRRTTIVPLTVVLALALAAAGFAQGTDTKPPASYPGKTDAKPPASQAQAQTPAQASSPSQPAQPEPSSLEAQLKANAQVDAKPSKLEAIRRKGAQTSANARSKADAKLATAAHKVDGDASAQGEAKVAGRLAAEFGMTPEDLTAEHQLLGGSWGELMIAHSLIANSTTEVTAEELFSLHKDGTGWGQIAAGLGLHLGEAVSAAQAEAKVASGVAKADGKVAVIHGEGARAGVAANAGTQVGAPVAGAARAGVGVGGVKIKP